jgi:hypothetical protein
VVELSRAASAEFAKQIEDLRKYGDSFLVYAAKFGIGRYQEHTAIA